MTVILWIWLILTWVNWVTSCVRVCTICLMINDTRLGYFISLGVLFIACCFFQWLTLLVIDLAVTVTWHNWTLLAMMYVFHRLLTDCTVSKSWISRLARVVLLEVVNFLILRICSSYNILLSISHTVLHYDVGTIMATSAWLYNTTLLDWAKCLIRAMDRANRALSWYLVLRVLARLTNSKLQKLFNVLWGNFRWSSNLNNFGLCLVVSTRDLFSGILGLACIGTCWMPWALSWVYTFRNRLTLIVRAWLSFWATVSWVLSGLIRCVPPEEISALWTDLEVTWTWAIWILLSHHIRLHAASSMSLILSIVNCLLLLIWNLLQKRKVIGFSVFFSNFWWIHILWINNF